MAPRPKLLALVVVAMTYLPLVAVLALVGYAFGWKIPLVFLLPFAVVWVRGRRTGFRPTSEGRVRTTAELAAFSLLGSIVGGLLFGALGVFFGFCIGLMVRLSEVPVTRRRDG
jgi:hypothetical protein